MFDVTRTDIEFKRDFVNRNADWLQNSRPSEPDFEIDGLEPSLFARLLSLLGLS